MTRPTPMLDAAIRDFLYYPAEGVQDFLEGDREKHASLWPVMKAVLRQRFPWTPLPEVIEVMAKGIWDHNLPEDEECWEALNENTQHVYRIEALAAYRAHPLMSELWPEEER